MTSPPFFHHFAGVIPYSEIQFFSFSTNKPWQNVRTNEKNEIGKLNTSSSSCIWLAEESSMFLAMPADLSIGGLVFCGSNMRVRFNK